VKLFDSADRARNLAQFNEGVRWLQLIEERAACQESFFDFVRCAWSFIDPSPFEECWAVHALCEHLQAISDGRIRKLLINLPPRCGKSLITSVCWPAWVWTRQGVESPLAGPRVRFLCASYSYELSLAHSTLTRRLLNSEWYQERWGPRFRIVSDQNTKSKFDNSEGGTRAATSVGGTLLGVGGDILICDDPHNVENVISEAERRTTTDWWKEFSTTRMNDPRIAAIAVVMQRLDEADVSGLIIDSDEYETEWDHLMIPMRHDTYRHCTTTLPWEDPRSEDGELMWPERFGPPEVERLEKTLGPYLSSGRLQQSPEPAGGGIIKRDWWQLWPAQKYPSLEFVIASLDPAYTEKELNDPSALTIWGVFRDNSGNPKVMLMYAWQARLELNDLVRVVGAMCSTNKLAQTEEVEVLTLAQRGELRIEWLPRFQVDRLLIENKASGISAAQELRRLYINSGEFAVELVDPSKWGDKISRLYAVQHLFSDEMIYAPDRSFADMVIRQVSVFPKGKHDDLVDTTSLALRWLRLTGIAQMREEHGREVRDRLAFKGQREAVPLY
jgi:hypothetical protein